MSTTAQTSGTDKLNWQEAGTQFRCVCGYVGTIQQMTRHHDHVPEQGHHCAHRIEN